MTTRNDYQPGAADLAHVEKDGEAWRLVLVKELRHEPEKVWEALTDPVHLREWAPFDADGSLGTVGAKVRLTTLGAADRGVSDTEVTRADAPNLLEYKWGEFNMRWQLEPLGQGMRPGTRLTLWTNIPRPYIAMGAAGWQICFDVLDHLLTGTPIGRITGPEAMAFEGWQRLHKEYAQKFGVEMPQWLQS